MPYSFNRLVAAGFIVSGAILVATCGATARAQTTLAPGDLAFVGYSATNPDNFGLVSLRDIAAGTTFTVTDNAYTSTAGPLATTEGTLTYTAPAALPAGSVISFTDGNPTATNSPGFGGTAFAGNAGFSGSGDNLFVFQGAAATPSLLASFSTRDYLTTGVTSSNTTYLPSTLTLGFSALTINAANSATINNGVYNGPTTGSASDLRTALFNPANFTTGNTNVPATSFPQAFVVTTVAVPEPGTLALLGLAGLPVAGVVVRRRKIK